MFSSAASIATRRALNGGRFAGLRAFTASSPRADQYDVVVVGELAMHVVVAGFFRPC